MSRPGSLLKATFEFVALTHSNADSTRPGSRVCVGVGRNKNTSAQQKFGSYLSTIICFLIFLSQTRKTKKCAGALAQRCSAGVMVRPTWCLERHRNDLEKLCLFLISLWTISTTFYLEHRCQTLVPDCRFAGCFAMSLCCVTLDSNDQDRDRAPPALVDDLIIWIEWIAAGNDGKKLPGKLCWTPMTWECFNSTWNEQTIKTILNKLWTKKNKQTNKQCQNPSLSRPTNLMAFCFGTNTFCLWDKWIKNYKYKHTK